MPSTNDDYIKTSGQERKLGLPRDTNAEALDAAGALAVPEDVAIEAAIQLGELDWRQPMTRDQIRARCRALPLGVYLRLPDSKRFRSAGDVLREAGIAPSRAEGDFMGANPDYPADESVDDGGPPGWGGSSGVFPIGASIQGGSAEDSEGLLPGERPGQEPASE
jgi:hypothetical protein